MSVEGFANALVRGKSYEGLAKALLRGEVYFGAALRALQVPLERYAYLDAIVGQIRSEAPHNLRLLEIGSWAGGSTITLASALLRRDWMGKIKCVDQWIPYFDLERSQLNPDYREMNEAADEGLIYPLFLHNVASAGIERLVEVHKGPTSDVLPQLPKAHFDLIFVDASHIYEDVLFDITHACVLVRDGGIICGDDLEMQAHDVNPQELKDALKARLDYLTCGDPVKYAYHPGVTAAVAEVFGRVSCWSAVWAVRKEGDQWVPANLPDTQILQVPVHFHKETCSQDRYDSAVASLAVLKNQRDTALAELNALKKRHDTALVELGALKNQHDMVLVELNALKSQYETALGELNTLKNQYETALIGLKALKNQHEMALTELSAIYQSTSWKMIQLASRLLAPFRRL